jgi:hypothetical protein
VHDRRASVLATNDDSGGTLCPTLAHYELLPRQTVYVRVTSYADKTAFKGYTLQVERTGHD